MEVDKLESLIESALARAKRLDDCEAEVYAVHSREKSITVARSRFEVPKVGSTIGLAVRLSCGKRVSVTGGVVSSHSQVENLLDHALKMCRANPGINSWRGLPRGLSRTGVHGLRDERIAELSTINLAELAEEVASLTRDFSKARVELARGVVNSTTTRRIVANTHGERVEEEGTVMTLVFEGVAREAGVESSYWNHVTVRRLIDLDIKKFASTIVERTLAGLRRYKVESGVYEVLLAPKVAASIIETLLAPAVSALSIQQRRSPLAGRLDSLVLSDSLTIVDDGTLEAMAGARGFDDEGVPVKRKTVIEKGVFKTPLYDTMTSYVDGVESTGNAVRARLSSMPEPAPINLIVEPGSETLDSLASSIKKGLVVYGVIGEWLSDYTRGYLNATIVNADYVENGDVKGAVVNGVLSGDFYELLGSKLKALGRDLENSGVIYSPSILIDGVKVAL